VRRDRRPPVAAGRAVLRRGAGRLRGQLAARRGHRRHGRDPRPRVLRRARLLRRSAHGTSARGPHPGTARLLRCTHVPAYRPRGELPHTVERRPLGGQGLSPPARPGLDGLLADLGVGVPIRHAVSSIVRGEPSAVQSLALGDAVSGRDVLAVAPQLTGSPSAPGRPRAVIVAPTRELAAQSTEILADVGAAAGLRVASFVGGQPLSRDRRTLVAPVDVVVGTPGRLVELLRTGILSAQDARVLVLDEADQLVGPSFAEQTGVLLDRCPDAVLLSATATADDAVEDDLRARRPAVRIHRVATPSGPAPADAAGAS